MFQVHDKPMLFHQIHTQEFRYKTIGIFWEYKCQKKCQSTAMILMLAVNMISFHLVVSEIFHTPLAEEGGGEMLGEEGLVSSLN